MKAWFDKDGFIHVAATTSAEKFAMRWNRDNLERADANGIILHEDEPVNPIGVGGPVDTKPSTHR